ncbi:hypothetical protein ABZ502_17765 [Streptomyces abikoensis]|uniref:hypothetical protein n=1 Tax=Streptomyces abikoensis TaxID=97398 RepID=UPI0033D4DA4D
MDLASRSGDGASTALGKDLSVIRVARWLLTALLTIGFVCGVIRCVQDDDAGDIRRLVTAFVGGIADVTCRWVPPTVEFLAGLISDVLGQAG